MMQLIRGFAFLAFAGLAVIVMFRSCSAMKDKEDAAWLESRAMVSAEDISQAIKKCGGVSSTVADAKEPLRRGELASAVADCLNKLETKKQAESDALVLQAQKKALNN